MASKVCPICHDPRAYPLWVSAEPPDACAVDTSWHAGGPRTIHCVSECSYQRKKAWQAAEFRKLAPESFDDAGNMKPDGLARCLEAFARQHPTIPLVV